MKRARQISAVVAYVVVWFAFLPFAVIRVSTEWLVDSLAIPMLESLEVIANDDPQQSEISQ
jgi:hypothetical protein